MGRTAATLGGILVLAVLAGGLTEATLAVGHSGSISDDVLLRPQQTHAPIASSKPTPVATATPTPSASPTPVATTQPTSTQELATTNAFVHLRATSSTSSAILLNLNGGSQVEVLSISNAQWQEVEYGGVIGYVYKTYLDY